MLGSSLILSISQRNSIFRDPWVRTRILKMDLKLAPICCVDICRLICCGSDRNNIQKVSLRNRNHCLSPRLARRMNVIVQKIAE